MSRNKDPGKMQRQLTDHNLVHEARAGSRAATELLMRRYERRVYRICLGMTRNVDDALDLTQESLLRAFSRLDSFEGKGSFQSWLLQVTNRVCLNWLRSRRCRPETEELTDLNAPTTVAGQETELERIEVEDWLRAELEKLNDRERLALGLRYFEQMPLREVAAMLECSVGTAKSLLFRTLRKLRQRMAPGSEATGLIGDQP